MDMNEIAKAMTLLRTERRGREKSFTRKDTDYPRVCGVIRRDRRALEYVRRKRVHLARLIAGKHWSEEGSGHSRPVNLLALYRQVIGRNLIAKNPRVLLSTFARPDRPAVGAMQTWANRRIEELNLSSVYRRAVDDALFSYGAVYCGISTPAEAALSGWSKTAGQPYMSVIDGDDHGFDQSSRDIGEGFYETHRLRVPLDAVKDSRLYSGAARRKLQPDRYRQHNADGDERIGMLSRTYSGFEFEDVLDFTTIWVCYLPYTKRLLTLASNDDGEPDGDEEPLLDTEWVGPDDGPYDHVFFGTVPGNARPIGPMAQSLIDLDEIANHTFRKLTRQAQRQKEVLPVQGGQDEDVQRLTDADDGAAYRSQGVPIQPARYGGPSAENYQFFEAVRGLFDFVGGNLALLGGRSPQSKTATQDRMLNENAAAGIADMQEAATAFVSRTMKKLCWFWWHDPFTTMKTEEPFPGMPDMTFQRQVTPRQRHRGKWADVAVRVDPYSLRFQPPEAKVRALDETVQTIIIPLAGLLQQQGVVFNLPKYLEKRAAYLDNPDLTEIVSIQDPPELSGEGEGVGVEHGATGKPPVTQRNYTRESVPQQGGEANQRVAAMFGAGGRGRPQGLGMGGAM